MYCTYALDGLLSGGLITEIRSLLANRTASVISGGAYNRGGGKALTREFFFHETQSSLVVRVNGLRLAPGRS